MPHEMELNGMTVADLAQKCAQETELYFKSKEFDTRYCFELFQRAIRNSDERALEVLILQYQPLVTRWVDKWINKHPEISFSEEPQDFVAQAFERFWISYTPAKIEKAKNSLPAVLKYLQMCVNGAITDAWRKLRRLQIDQESQDEEQEGAEQDPTPEEVLEDAEIWELIKRKAKDPKEYIVLYALYYLSLSPREILAEYPGTFKDAKEIYQHRVNFLERLERDEEIKKYFRRR